MPNFKHPAFVCINAPISQELRLGNLIHFENKVLEVVTIGTEFCVLSDGTNTYDAWYDEVQPIPLTEEWLLKYGFKKQDSEYPKGHEDYHEWLERNLLSIGWMCQRDDKTYIFNEDETLKIYHLHRLQNLYHALTGRELES